VLPEKRVMVGAQLVWGALSGNGGVEHPTEGDTIDIPCMHPEANEAPRELVHDHPMGVEYNGLATKKINAS
jgi:hypothetical protein